MSSLCLLIYFLKIQIRVLISNIELNAISNFCQYCYLLNNAFSYLLPHPGHFLEVISLSLIMNILFK